MTIAIALKVTDGVVLGTDSAVSLLGSDGRYDTVFNNAEKTFHLVRGLPVGVMTYGLASLADLSISSLIRTLRARLAGSSRPHDDWRVDPEDYTIASIAQRLAGFFYEELYLPAYGGARREPPPLGFMLAGFSAEADHPEVWTVEIEDGQCDGPVLALGPAVAGKLVWRGDSEALERLIFATSPAVWERAITSGLDAQSARNLLVDFVSLADPAMPLQDAIDLVRYLAEVAAGFARFRRGPATVAPPIDIAAITRHQGFRWIARKHYYSRELNPLAAFTGG